MTASVSAAPHAHPAGAANENDQPVSVTLSTAEYDALDSADFLRARADALDGAELGSLGSLLREVARRLDDVHDRWHRARVVAAGLQGSDADSGHCLAATGASPRSMAAHSPTPRDRCVLSISGPRNVVRCP